MVIKKDYFIGDRFFYRNVFWIVMPIIIQNTITNVVSLLDNIMVGRIGTIEMSAVAIVNQLIFIFNLAVFGALAGTGIFSTQYAGAGNDEGMRHCFRLKVYTIIIILLLAGLIFGGFSENLINLFLADNTKPEDMLLTRHYGVTYMQIMLIGITPFAFSQIYSSTLREKGETKLPMYASVAAIFINLIFNYLLIFGKMGFPCLGVAGAAIATALSRFVEMAILIIFTHKRSGEFSFIKGVYKSLYVPSVLCKNVIKRGTPLLFNEILWSMGMSAYLQCYSARGLMVVAASNIASTVNNIFNVVLISIGCAISIMVGQYLGANEVERAKKTVWRLLFLSVGCCILLGLVLILLSGLIPKAYNVENEVKLMASSFHISLALMLPLDAFIHGSYFTLRSGGKTILTFFFDSGFMWIISVPFAFILSNFTGLGIELVYFLVRALDIIKAIIATILIRKGVWISNIVRQ